MRSTQPVTQQFFDSDELGVISGTTERHARAILNDLYEANDPGVVNWGRKGQLHLKISKERLEQLIHERSGAGKKAAQ
ncbi:MAG TPA: hypothetical protein VGR48_07230 [Terriglobales bacterium]|nr:hypothetical protein [Terriglobales bacterium]